MNLLYAIAIQRSYKIHVQVYEALSSKNYGASSTQMNDIAQDTYD